MRERRKFWKNLLVQGRITPAYAGKTRLCQNKRLCIRDHPRVCGKDKRHCNRSTTKRGSPPRMRERLDYARIKDFASGITPAYAGKTYESRYPKRHSWDHPRVCGKDSLRKVILGFV